MICESQTRKTEILRDPVGHRAPDEEIVIGAGSRPKKGRQANVIPIEEERDEEGDDDVNDMMITIIMMMMIVMMMVMKMMRTMVARYAAEICHFGR